MLAQGQKKNGAWHEIENMCVTREALNSENSNFRMSQLKGDTCYRIEVKAHNAIGFSQGTSLLMRTALGESTNELGPLTYDLAAGVAGGFGTGTSGGGGGAAMHANAARSLRLAALSVLFAACACFMCSH